MPTIPTRISATLLAGIIATSTAGAGSAMSPVVVRLFSGGVGIPARGLSIAKALLRDGNIDPTWVVVRSGQASERLQPADIIVRIVSSRSTVDPARCGEALIPGGDARARFITLFAACVVATAVRFHVDADVVWGGMLAHEIGHLLVTPAHTTGGIMAAEIDWRLAELGVVRFTSEQKTVMREWAATHRGDTGDR